VPRLPQRERKAIGEVPEGDLLLLGEVPAVVVDQEQGRAAGGARLLNGGNEFPGLPDGDPRVVPPRRTQNRRVAHTGLGSLA